MHRTSGLLAAAGLSLALGYGVAQAQTVALTYMQPLTPQSVRIVQQQLARAGDYQGALDGQWGPDSVIALQRFQEQHGIQPSGQLNEPTAAALGIDPAMLVGQPAGFAYGTQNSDSADDQPARGCGGAGTATVARVLPWSAGWHVGSGYPAGGRRVPAAKRIAAERAA